MSRADSRYSIKAQPKQIHAARGNVSGWLERSESRDGARSAEDLQAVPVGIVLYGIFRHRIHKER